MAPPKYRLVIKNALLIPMDKSQEQSFIGTICVSHKGHIASLDPTINNTNTNNGETPEATTTIDAAGKMLLPGFISAHSHLWQSAFPGRACSESVTGWADDIYGPDVAGSLSAEDMYALARRGAQSHVHKGITTAFNFTFSPGFRDGRGDRAQFCGARDAGIRFVHGFNVGAVSPVWTRGQAVARTGRFLDWVAEQGDEAGLYLGTAVANHGVIYGDWESTMVEAEIMHRFGLQGHLHYLESSLPEDIAAERSRWSWLKEAGLVGPALMLGHFLHPTTEMIREVVAAGVRMSWNPLSNGRLASGIADIPAYLKQSLSIGLGVDGEASSDRCDPFENMRMGLYSVRGMYKDPNALMPYDVLHMHTLGAAESLGVDDKVGSLTVGKYADMVFVEPPYSLLDSDSISTLVLSAGVEHVKEVFVGGLPVSSTSGTPTRTGVEWPPWEF